MINSRMWKFVYLAICCELIWAQTDYVPTDFEEVNKGDLDSFGAQDKCGDGKLSGRECVPYYRCDPETNTTTPEAEKPKPDFDYSLLIDIRLGETNPCPETLQVCCKSASSSPSTDPPNTQSPPVTPDTVPKVSYCGIRNNNGIDFKITGNTHNEAEYGEFPWMVAILKSDYNPSVDPSLSICGGSLLGPRVILTGAHCVRKFQANNLKVRAGEWDTQTENERYPYQERDVSQIILHENFKEGVLHNDIALLVLDRPFKKAKHIGTICLPNQNEAVVSRECYATGWGKNLFGKEGEYQVILKKIDLPIVPSKKCENELRKTRLGEYFKLHESFICAGGVPGKDTCTGDGGSPLVCVDSNNPGRYIQAGIVAWGIGCGSTIPGVYTDVGKFREWIDQQMERLNLSTQPYIV